MNTLKKSLDKLGDIKLLKYIFGTFFFILCLIIAVGGIALMYASFAYIGEGSVVITIEGYGSVENVNAHMLSFLVGCFLTGFPAYIMWKAFVKIVRFEPPVTVVNWIAHHDLFS